MDINIPKNIKDTVSLLIEANFQVYLVGGALRDLLLEREIKDWDLATDASPETMLTLLPHAFTNNKFGTVSIPQNSNESSEMSLIEITTMREESDYSDSRHPDNISWTKDIKLDLARRDFTINALALDLSSSKPNIKDLIDPFNGKSDLKDKLIRSVGNPDQRFKEDALRLLRAIRFSCQLEFTIEPETFSSIQENAPLIENISHERIRDELLKILLSNYPYEGMLLLRNATLLQYILPELENCFGITQEGPKHDRIYDIGEHSLLTLKFCQSSDPIVRLACLLHDIGKPATYKVEADGNATFYNHEVAGSHITKDICSRLHLSKAQTEKVISLIRWHMFSVDEHQTDSAIRRIIRNVGLANIEDMLILRSADRLGGGTQNATSWRLENFKARIKQVLEKPFSLTDLKINGKDVMETLNIPPGRQIGSILNQLFEQVLEDKTKNEHDYLIDQVKLLGSKS